MKEELYKCEYLLKEGFEALFEDFAFDARGAERALCRSRRRNYVCATRRGDAFVLRKFSCVCPKCGMRHHIYSEDPGALLRRASDREIAEYLSPQLSFFRDQEADSVFLNEPVPLGSRVVCSRCGARGTLMERAPERRVMILAEDGRLTVSCELDDVFDALALGWVSSLGEDVSLGGPPYAERVEFDLESGATRAEVTDADGPACGIELTSEAELAGHDRITEVFGNFVLRRRLRSAFLAVYGRELCFSIDETDLDRFVLHTKFIGYEREFYESIPFEEDGSSSSAGKLPLSIEGISARLHRASEVPALYSELGLPSAKSVRRIVFESPQLLFHIEGLRILREVFPDLNYFRRLVSDPSVYRILAGLIRFANAKEYLVLAREVLGMGGLLRYMRSQDCEELFKCGMVYYALDGEGRTLVRERLMLSPEPMEEIDRMPSGPYCSVPMTHMRGLRLDWNYGGFRFRTLRSSADYERAGRELNNCLGRRYGADCGADGRGVFKFAFRQREETVVGVMRNGRFTAAVEVDSDGIVKFAALSDNRPIEGDRAFKEAYLAWLARFGLIDLKR